MFKINKFLSKSILNKIRSINNSNYVSQNYSNNLRQSPSNILQKLQYGSFSNKNDDLKNKFNKMMETQGISEEQLKEKKQAEEKRLNDEQLKSKIKYEENSQKLKDKFSRLKSGIQNDVNFFFILPKSISISSF